MTTNITEFVELQKAQLDTLNAISQTVFNATEKLVNLNLAAVKAAYQDAADSSQGLLGARDVQDFFGLVSSNSQPALEKVVGYSRNAYGIATGANAELTKIFEAQLSEGNRRVAEALDFATKNAPTGSEPIVSFVKTAIAATNTAVDTATKAVRQATDWAESNFAAAASATINAATAANDAVKSKTKKAA